MTPMVLTIDRIDPTACRIYLALPAAHPAFDGHFPGQPILPGVVQIEWAVRLAAECFGHPYRPVRRMRVKFLQLITPEPARFSLQLHDDTDRHEVSFAYRLDEALASTGTLFLA